MKGYMGRNRAGSWLKETIMLKRPLVTLICREQTNSSYLLLCFINPFLAGGTITSNGVETGGQPAVRINQNTTTVDTPNLSANTQTKIEVSNEKKGRRLITSLTLTETHL